MDLSPEDTHSFLLAAIFDVKNSSFWRLYIFRPSKLVWWSWGIGFCPQHWICATWIWICSDTTTPILWDWIRRTALGVRPPKRWRNNHRQKSAWSRTEAMLICRTSTSSSSTSEHSRLQKTILLEFQGLKWWIVCRENGWKLFELTLNPIPNLLFSNKKNFYYIFSPRPPFCSTPFIWFREPFLRPISNSTNCFRPKTVSVARVANARMFRSRMAFKFHAHCARIPSADWADIWTDSTGEGWPHPTSLSASNCSDTPAKLLMWGIIRSAIYHYDLLLLHFCSQS